MKSIYQDYDLQSYRNQVEKLSQPLSRNLGTVFWKNVRCAHEAAHFAARLIFQSEVAKMTGLELGEQLVPPPEGAYIEERLRAWEQENLSLEERLRARDQEVASAEEQKRAWEKYLSLQEDPSLSDELSKRVEARFRALEKYSDDFWQTSDSINSGSVIQLWSALEFLAAELWSAAVDSRPRSLGIAATEWALKQQPPLFYDRRRRLGRAFSDDKFKVGKFLRQNIDFSSARRIASYYEAIFPGVVLSGWVRPAKKLQAARNVLLHNGGVVNEQFLRLASGLPLVGGTKLKFWEVQVHVFSQATLGLGLRLLQAVDGWLASHPGDSAARSTSVH